jgi:proteasome lid subunit RPN8/RPN11
MRIQENIPMVVAVEKKFAVEVTYNGITKPIEVQPEQQVSGLLAKAIAAFGINQNQHLLSLFRENGTVVPENESVERAGLKPNEVLLLRPNAVKGGERKLLRLAVNVLGASFQTFHECGRGECECAVYWTGPAGEDLIDSLEHPVHVRSRFGYEIDSGWLTEFWKSLAGLKRSIKAQVHTHPGPAFHSRTDDQWPIISQAGFLSIVIPDFAAGKPTLDRAWIGRLQSDGTWDQVFSTEQAFVLA